MMRPSRIAGQSGNFQLNVMLPVIAYNLLQSLELLAIGSRNLADHAIAGFSVNRERIESCAGAQPHPRNGAESHHRL